MALYLQLYNNISEYPIHFTCAQFRFLSFLFLFIFFSSPPHQVTGSTNQRTYAFIFFPFNVSQYLVSFFHLVIIWRILSFFLKKKTLILFKSIIVDGHWWIIDWFLFLFFCCCCWSHTRLPLICLWNQNKWKISKLPIDKPLWLISLVQFDQWLPISLFSYYESRFASTITYISLVRPVAWWILRQFY